MRTVSVGELRNQLRGYLEYVQNGEEILVRDRDVPIARILPLQQGAKHEHDASLAISEETSIPPEEMNWEQFFSHRTSSVSHEDAVAAAVQSRGEW